MDLIQPLTWILSVARWHVTMPSALASPLVKGDHVVDTLALSVSFFLEFKTIIYFVF